MAIAVFIDNSVWNFLFERQFDLAVELPREHFSIGITREAEFEIPPIRSPELRAFIDSTIQRCSVQTDSLFGFYNESLLQDEQRMGGFNVGRFASEQEIAFISKQRSSTSVGRKRPTKLYKNEADISLAARSFHSIVLTLDAKSGPLRDAYQQGGMVVFLNDFDTSGKSLRNFIKEALRLRLKNDLA
jgi:hypothetical protein